MDIDRINELFQKGEITGNEHHELLELARPAPQQTAGMAIACLVCGIAGWISMLTFTINGRVVGLLQSGEARLAAGGICSFLTIILYVLAKQRIGAEPGVGGRCIAVAGLTIALMLASIIVPVLLALIGQ